MFPGCWASAQNTGAASPQECCSELCPRPHLGLRPRPHWGLTPPDLLQNGVWGGASTGSGVERQLHSFGVEPQFPENMIQSSQPVWSSARSQICLNPVWRVGCESERSEPDRSKPETSAHQAKCIQTSFGDEAGHQTGGLIESCTSKGVRRGGGGGALEILGPNFLKPS